MGNNQCCDSRNLSHALCLEPPMTKSRQKEIRNCRTEVDTAPSSLNSKSSCESPIQQHCLTCACKNSHPENKKQYSHSPRKELGIKHIKSFDVTKSDQRRYSGKQKMEKHSPQQYVGGYSGG